VRIEKRLSSASEAKADFPIVQSSDFSYQFGKLVEGEMLCVLCAGLSGTMAAPPIAIVCNIKSDEQSFVEFHLDFPLEI